MSAGASAVPPSAAAATNGDTAPAVALPECEIGEKANACTEEYLSSFYDGVSTPFVHMVVSKHVHSAVVDQYVWCCSIKGEVNPLPVYHKRTDTIVSVRLALAF